MLQYVLRRILYVVPIGLGVSLICFSLIHLAPGDPIQAVVPDEASQADIERIRAAYGFDRPLPVQYLLWLGSALQGDFGVSLQSNRPVMGDLLPALRNTFLIAIIAAGLSFAVAFTLGLVAAYQHGRWGDKVVTGIAITGVSIPNYWAAIVLVAIFSVELGMLPAMGMGPGGSTRWQWTVANMRHLVLPVIALSLIPMGIIMRSTRAAVLDVLNQEFVETLRARGLGSGRILLHVVKNASPTVLAVTGLQFGNLLGGSILIETVFAWPGTGFLLSESVFRRDLPVLQGTILVLAMFFVVLNLLVDIAQTWLDPRMKRT